MLVLGIFCVTVAVNNSSLRQLSILALYFGSDSLVLIFLRLGLPIFPPPKEMKLKLI